MSLVKLILVLTIVTLVSGRLSWYYANQGTNYHPPYDKGVNTNSYNGSNPDQCYNSFTCPAGYSISVNNSYVPTITYTCPVPGWVTSDSALTQFNGCCLRYYSCLQVCGVNKAFCDGQFYGCAYTSCDPERNLRPGDRVYCRQLASCTASYFSRGSACSAFNTMQASACTCTQNSFQTTPTPFAGASQSPFFFNSQAPIPGQSIVGKRQTVNSESASPVATQSSSNIPSTTPSTTYTGSPAPPASSSVSLPQPSGLDYYNNLYAANFGQYFVRPIPVWELYQNRCPPNFENYVAVMIDQEQDDVNYFGAAASGSSLSSWTQLF